jgi:hypothetical protein
LKWQFVGHTGHTPFSDTFTWILNQQKIVDVTINKLHLSIKNGALSFNQQTWGFNHLTWGRNG